MSTTNIPLETPIKRGTTEITSIEIRKPDSGALRGVSLRDLLDFQTDAILKVLPRVTEPPLTAPEAARLDPADLVQAGAALAGFLLTRRALAVAEAEAAQTSDYPIQ